MSQIDSNSALEFEETLRVGRVIEVSGRTVRIRVDDQKNSAFLTYQGRSIRGVAVGTFIRILRGPVEIVGRVEGEFMSEASLGRPDGAPEQELRRTLTVAVIGKFDDAGNYSGGVTELPLISNVAYLLLPLQSDALFAFVRPSERGFSLGTLADNPEQALRVSADALLASHLGIFGNTGSGKSNTLAFLLRSLARRYKGSRRFKRRARFVILDFNGEYLRRDSREPITDDQSLKQDIDLGNPQAEFSRITLPVKALLDTDLWAVLLEATPKTQVPLLRRAIASGKLSEALLDEDRLKNFIFDVLMDMTREVNSSIERNSPASLVESLETVFGTTPGMDDAISFLRSQLVLNTTNQSFYFDSAGTRYYGDNDGFANVIWSLIEGVSLPLEDISEVRKFFLRVILQFHFEVARGYANREYLAPLIKRLETRLVDVESVIEFGSASADRVFTVIGLQRLSSELQRVVGVLVAKHAYDLQRLRRSPRRYLAVVVDEAHHVLSREASNESDQWRDYRLSVFESIVKEGRKFGAFLFVSSQRPFDISPTVLSQLHNYFLHRLVNVRDIEAIERLVPYLDRVSFEQIPMLATGTCVVTGVMVERPVMAAIPLVRRRFRPVSETMKPTASW